MYGQKGEINKYVRKGKKERTQSGMEEKLVNKERMR